jgi:hypothetical protein
LNFRGAYFEILSVAKYLKKAEIIPVNLHRIMPAKGENTAPPNPFRDEEYKAVFTSPGSSAQMFY